MPEDQPRQVLQDGADTTSLAPRATDYLTRWATFLLGVFVMSVGIAMSVHGQLGTAPISTLPAVVDAASSWSVGTVSAIMNIAHTNADSAAPLQTFPTRATAHRRRLRGCY